MKKNPAILLLMFVYFLIIPTCLSYQNAWVQPEELFIKSFLLKTGVNLNAQDLKSGLFWQLFEYKPRSTRPLSSYFEIIDTKFRCWLWRYMLPHPSLSLSWIFSLILAPLFLYQLLRNMNISPPVATTLVAFYLATPGVLSCEAMLFRPAKPMANFCIIFCLYLASTLKKGFLDKNRPIPAINFLLFWLITAVSFYWDETALLIFPAVLVIFPSLFKRKEFLFSWLLLPAITLTAYLKIIPYLTVLAGHDRPQLAHYDLVQSLFEPQTILHSLQYLGINSRNLILETMGIFPMANSAPQIIRIFMILAIFSWITIFVCLCRKVPWLRRPMVPSLRGEQSPTKQSLKNSILFDPLCIFLIVLLFLFNTIAYMTTLVWGPYYYGSFWTIFFVLFLAQYLERANIQKAILLTCFFFIIISTTNCFLGLNTINKKYYWYPYSPEVITDYFDGKRPFFDKRDAPFFSDKDVRLSINGYWSQARTGINAQTFSLPRELGWLPIEYPGTRPYDRSLAVLRDSQGRKLYLYTYTLHQGSIEDDSNVIEKIDPKLAEAYKVYSMDIAVNPKLAQAYNDRGNIYFQIGRYPQAIADYIRAVELNPNLAQTYFNLGLSYYKEGHMTQAVFNYSKALALDPKDIGAYNDRAIIYFKLKAYAKAWDDVRTIEQLGTAANPLLINALKQVTGNK